MTTILVSGHTMQFSGHTHFQGHTVMTPERKYIEVYVPLGRIWEIPVGGSIEIGSLEVSE